MKRIICFVLCVLLLATSLMSFASCSKDPTPNSPADAPNDQDPADTPNEPEYTKVDPSTLVADKTYDNNYGSLLSSYTEGTVETYEGVCAYYEDEGWSLYCESSMNNNLFSTYTKESKIAHVYWINSQTELNIITSDSGAEDLPPVQTEAVGDVKTSVIQLQQKKSQLNGMAYIVQLSDGSFIVYDGGYADTVGELLETLKSLAGSDDVHIRAWVMTHAHSDHYDCFEELATNYKDKYSSEYSINITLDYFLIAPISREESDSMNPDGNFYANRLQNCMEAFSGAKVCYVHTGMKFNFANVTMEILFTPEELFIDGSTNNFNDSSIISRIYSADPLGNDTMSMIFLGDAGSAVADRLMSYYKGYLNSDMCQVSHHGVEDFPLMAYKLIRAQMLFYPCNTDLYNLEDRDGDVRRELSHSKVTKEVLLRDKEQYRRFFDPSLNPEPVEKP